MFSSVLAIQFTSTPCGQNPCARLLDNKGRHRILNMSNIQISRILKKGLNTIGPGSVSRQGSVIVLRPKTLMSRHPISRRESGESIILGIEQCPTLCPVRNLPVAELAHYEGQRGRNPPPRRIPVPHSERHQQTQEVARKNGERVLVR